MAISLNSGFEMPLMGLGLWRMEKDQIGPLIITAIKLGYRHFDCAAHYKNEVEVGKALAEAFRSGLVKREDVFITSKASLQLWNSDHGHVVGACRDSLKKLQLEYLDLYLIHFPIASTHTGVGTTGSVLDEDRMLDMDTTISLESTWHDMEKLVSLGLEARNICATAHTPLGGSVANTKDFGSISCLDDPILKGLAKKYEKSAAQIVLRWGIQRNIAVIPKTSKVERLKENLQVLDDFKLSKEDMDLIKTMDRKYRTNPASKSWGLDVYA
ncbi:putative mannose-6-phosphate 6-reductase [Rosa chinensis]|uniref:Putative mannose-6-phosphate 6-reductase n=1 Tax=Rosa chinensis TaxID=74649 RepID=A0A2P6PQ45_ROSCH|nr:putative mannose-6-phosphate 6-reductase [Rosa chinensis]